MTDQEKDHMDDEIPTDITEAAFEAYPASMAVEGFPGEEDRYVDDEWGYDEAQRSAFIRGARWAREQDRPNP